MACEEVTGSALEHVILSFSPDEKREDERSKAADVRQPFHLGVWWGQSGGLAPQSEPRGGFMSFGLSSYRLFPLVCNLVPWHFSSLRSLAGFEASRSSSEGLSPGHPQMSVVI